MAVSLPALNASLAIACVAALGACAPDPTPEEAFDRLEARLLAATEVRLEFHAVAAGAVTADLEGELAITPDGEIALTADGTFAGEPASLRLATQGSRYYAYGTGTERTIAARPADLEAALIVGLMRMGILHNLAALHEQAAPDHAQGGVREWVTVDAFRRDEQDAIAFDITVAGMPAGFASLAVDANGVPVERHQTVRFPSGEMRVVETYADMTIKP